MADIIVNPDNLDKAVNDVLSDYYHGTNEEIKKAALRAIRQCRDEIKAHITFNQHTGDYVKAMAVKKTDESTSGVEYTWFVKPPHYRLTHLLEKGHALRNGGRTKAFPHIKFGEEVGVTYFIAEIRRIFGGDN